MMGMEHGISGLLDLIALGVICFVLVRFILQAIENSKLPEVQVSAHVLAKRIAVNGATTVYYATFEMESGERRELSVSGSEFSMLVEGDSGLLTYQGTWYKGFVRQRELPEV